MSWTEPTCNCGGSGADGCQPYTADNITTGLTELCRTIAEDMAGWQGLLSTIRHDALQALPKPDTTTSVDEPVMRALPAANPPIGQVFEAWLQSLEQPNA